MSDLAKLAKPFPDRYVKKPPKGKYGSYVKHSTIAEALLATTGPYDLHVSQVIRGDVAGFTRTNDKTKEVVVYPDLDQVVVAVIASLTLQIDGRSVTVEEAGDCDDPHNWSHDGQRLKDAVSDAVKRCAMRFGLGLHLWSQEDYFLYDSLTHKEMTRRPKGPERGNEQARQVEAASPVASPTTSPTADSPVAKAKKIAVREMCRRAGLDPDDQAQQVGAVSLDACDLEQLEQIIVSRTTKGVG